MEKIFKQKNFNNFVWTPLGSRVICHRCQQHKRNWWQNLPPVSLKTVANLPPVLFVDTGVNFATGVNNTGAPWAANISAIFRKKSKWPWCYFQGLGGTWFMKKTWSKKSRDTVPLMGGWGSLITHRAEPVTTQSLSLQICDCFWTIHVHLIFKTGHGIHYN